MMTTAARPPIGIRLLGALLLIVAAAKLPALYDMLTGAEEALTFLGFRAPTPLPELQELLSVPLLVLIGIGLLRRKGWGRLLFLIGGGLTLFMQVVGLVQVLLAWRTEMKLPVVEDDGTSVSEVTIPIVIMLLFSLLITGAAMLYIHRSKQWFQGEEGPPEERPPFTM